MYIIGKKNINGIYASDEQATYEAEALLTDETSDKWKAFGSTAIVTAGVTSGSGLLIANTNADTITVGKANHIDMDWGDASAWGAINSAAWQSYADSGQSVTKGTDAYGMYHAWISYTEDTDDHLFNITLTNSAGDPVEAGAVYAGTVIDLRDYRYDVGMGLQSKSPVFPLGRRSEYVDHMSGDVRRTWYGSLVMPIADWFTFRDAARVRGNRPLAWLLSEGYSTGEWVVLAKFLSFPNAIGVGPELVEVTFEIEES